MIQINMHDLITMNYALSRMKMPRRKKMKTNWGKNERNTRKWEEMEEAHLSCLSGSERLAMVLKMPHIRKSATSLLTDSGPCGRPVPYWYYVCFWVRKFVYPKKNDIIRSFNYWKYNDEDIIQIVFVLNFSCITLKSCHQN